MSFNGGAHALRMPSVGLWVPAVLVGALCLVPPLYLVVRALGEPAGAWETITARSTLLLLLRTLGFATTVTLLAAAVALPMAWLTTRTDLPGRRVIAFLSPMPLAIPSYVGALVAISMFSPRGMLQQMLAPLGVTQVPSIYGFWGATVVLALVTYPYLLLTLRPAMATLDPRLEELSRTFGYGRWTTMRRVVFPQLRPALASGGLLVMLYALSDFGAPALLRFDSFTRVIFIRYQSSFERGEAAALALVLGTLALTVVALEVWSRGSMRYDSPHRRRPAVVSLGRWRWIVLIFPLLVLAVTLALPLAVLLFWLLRAFDAVGAPVGLLPALTGSATAGALAALATTAIALPVALLSVRRPRAIAARSVEVLSYTGYALPGLVVALALVFAAIRVPFLYQSLTLLIAAYALLFLPQAVGAARVGLVRVRPSMEEAGRGLGRGPLAVLRTVTLPLASRGILAGAALVFLSVMKELPATLILSPIGFRTLATRVWSTSSEGLYAQAALPALLLVALSAVPVVLANLGRRDD